MAILDLQGNTLSAASPPIATNPNADLAIKAPVRVATTGGNITLSGLQTIDGVALAAGDRVLVKDQTDATTNGLYNAATGQWTRTIDANNNSLWTQGLMVSIATGTTNASATFKLTSANPIILGTTALTWTAITIPSIIAGLTINPATGTFNRGFTITQSPAGSAASTQSYNLLQISDTASITGLTFGIGFNIFMNFGGSSVQGGREGIQSQVTLTATTNPSTSNQNYVGGQFYAVAQANDNGAGLTTGTARGSFFGASSSALLQAGATNIFNVTGYEFNCGVATGASVALKSLIQLATDASDRVQGAVVDTMIWAYSQSVSNPGWNNFILLDNTAGLGAWPIKSTGTIFKTGGSGTAANGIDFSNTTFSGNAFASPNFSVDNSGNILVNGVVSILRGTPPAAGGTTDIGYSFSNVANFGVFFGTGNPTLSGAKGSLYLENGTGQLWLNTSGSTTWTQVTVP